MRPKGLRTRIFLDSGDPAETRTALDLLGFLDGQTTNPSLIAKHPEAQRQLQDGKKFEADHIYDFYKQVVSEVSSLIPNGSVSIEVYADHNTPTDEMLAQGSKMFGWIPNAHIKYPTTTAGLAAAEQSVKQGMRVNMTLCFSQEQAAAVYAATLGAQPGQVFVSPFIGRLDDKGQNGLDLVENIVRMYKDGDGHVAVLAASVRTLEHFTACLALGADIITAPLGVLQEWAEHGMPVPSTTNAKTTGGLANIPYRDLPLDKPWQSYNIAHELTDVGLERFSTDWNALIEL